MTVDCPGRNETERDEREAAFSESVMRTVVEQSGRYAQLRDLMGGDPLEQAERIAEAVGWDAALSGPDSRVPETLAGWVADEFRDIRHAVRAKDDDLAAEREANAELADRLAGKDEALRLEREQLMRAAEEELTKANRAVSEAGVINPGEPLASRIWTLGVQVKTEREARERAAEEANVLAARVVRTEEELLRLGAEIRDADDALAEAGIYPKPFRPLNERIREALSDSPRPDAGQAREWRAVSRHDEGESWALERPWRRLKEEAAADLSRMHVPYITHARLEYRDVSPPRREET